MSAPVAIEPITQKDIADCGIAALAMVLGQPYRLVSEAALKVVRKPHKRGLWNTDIQRIAASLGVRLVARRTVSEDATGALVLARPRDGHMVALFQGVVINPADGLVWDLSAYLSLGSWRVKTLFEVAE